MMLPKFTKREQILTLATIAIVGSTVVYGFIIEPLARFNTRLNRQISTRKLKLERNYKLLNQTDLIEAEYARYKDFIKPLSSIEEEIATMLKAIEAIARKADIQITNIRPQPVKDRMYYQEIAFELICEADITKLLQFMYDLQTSGNLLAVNRLTISAGAFGQDVLKAVIVIAKPSIFQKKI